MQPTRFALCLICVKGVMCDTRKLRGGPLVEPHLWPQFVEKADPVTGQKTLAELDDFHTGVIVPLSSVKHFASANAGEALAGSAVWVFFVVLAAFLYKQSRHYLPDQGTKPLDPFRTQEELSQWQSEWYQCYRYPEIFCWSCCCPCIRWAHTMDWLQILDYWPAFCMYFVLSVTNQLFGFFVFGILFSIMLVYYRQRMRMLFGMPNQGTCVGYMTDFLGFCFCWPCLIAQEANQVAEAARMGWTLELAAKPDAKRFDASVSASQES